MMFFLFIIFLSYTIQSNSTPLNLIKDLTPGVSYAITLSQNDFDTEINHLHEKMVLPLKSFTAINSQPISFHTKRLHIAGQTITRSTPIIDNIVVEGADGILNDRVGIFSFTHFEKPKSSFRLSAAECIEQAIKAHGFSTLKNPYVEKTQGLFTPIWLMHFGQLRPAFKIRLPTISIFDLKDIYVDAENGEILQIEDSAQFAEAQARLFVYSPKSPIIDESELKPVILKNLISLKEGSFLRGEYINVRNCCKFFTCPEDDECIDENKRCALESHKNARQRREIIELPTETLGLDALASIPETVTVDTVRCTYLHFAKASYKNPKSPILGFFDKPIDNESKESEIDRFSEIQAYFSIMSFFHNIRSLLDDNTWCLREEAMSCNKDGSPVLDKEGNPKNPYRVFVNQMIPDMKMDGPIGDPDNFLTQLMDGKGTRDNPVKLSKFTRIGNAAFVPALSTLKKNTPRADEILSDLIKPYDHNVFFQGERDFAYDGDVVFHEFMHAITTSLIGKINSLGLDEWGIHSEPGGLNEAWSDYFSAAFTNHSAIGEYASIKDGFSEVALRNIDNVASCPEDIIGEPHNDGLIWSGSLWQIRSSVKKSFGETAAIEFDRAVLASLAESTIKEDFKTQSEKLIKNIKKRDGLGEKVAAIAESIFLKRGIRNCFRANTLSAVDNQNNLETNVKKLLFIPSKNQIGLKNYAPATSQFEIGIPASAKGLTISWRQFLGGSGSVLGTEVTPDSTKNVIPLKVLTNFDIPISWQFKHAYAIPTKQNQILIEDEPKDAHYENGYWQLYLPLDFDRCEQKTMYVSLLSNDYKYVLENISVNFDMDKTKDLSDCNFLGTQRLAQDLDGLQGCSTTRGNNISIIFLLCLIGVFRIIYLGCKSIFVYKRQ